MNVLKLLPRFQKLEGKLREFETRENWTAAEVTGFQLEQINRLWTHARQSVPYYNTLASQQSLPVSFTSLEEFSQLIPLLHKTDVRKQPANFMSRDSRPGRWQFSGGSTGVPMKIYWEAQAHQDMLFAKYRSEQAHGIDVFDKKVFFWGHSASFAPGWRGRWSKIKRPIEDRLRNRLRLSAYRLGNEDLKLHLSRIQDFAPHSIYGYSSAVDLLAQAAAESGVAIPTLRLAITTAEPSDSAMRQRISDNFNARCVTEYGAVECGLMGYQMPDETIRAREDVVFMETIPDSTGGYEIVITVLNNPSFPLMRYRIGDHTSKPIVRPARGFAIMHDIRGRSNDMLVSKSGDLLHPMSVKHVLEHWPSIRRFRAHQSVDGNILVTLESPSDLPLNTQRSIQNQLEQLTGGHRVSLQTTEAIPGNAAGKHRWIVTEVDHRTIRKNVCP